MKKKSTALKETHDSVVLCTTTSPDIATLGLDDPPSVVRQHISNVLHYQHEVARIEAENVAAAWQLGLGFHYQNMSTLQQFNEQFGEEYGEALYGSEVLRKEKLRKVAAGLADRERCIAASLFFCVFVAFWIIVVVYCLIVRQ